jgi:hypothetical protein
MDRAQLEQMALEKIAKMQTVPSSSNDRAALERMALEKMASMNQTPVNKDNEASLGVINRSRYAIEPLQSNRKALLVQEFGEDNVMEDGKGDLFVKQNNQFLPLNKEGASIADAADFLGATPEMAGGAVGALVGSPTGPGAVVSGAAGGAAGSLIRQAVSTALGTPQVASAGERAVETGISGTMGGLMSGVAHVAKPYIQEAKQGITQFIKNLGKNAADTATETSSKTVANTAMKMGGKMDAVYENADDIAKQIEPHGEREAVKENMAELEKIAARENLPKPTIAQAAQGKAIIAENKILDMPLVGGKVRKQADQQAKLVKKNLESITGRPIDFDNDIHVVGQAVRENAETAVAARKKIARELYDAVDNEGARAQISKKTLLNKYRDEAAKHGLIDPEGNPLPYHGAADMTEETFNKLQKMVVQGLDVLKKTPSTKIPFASANGLVKNLKAQASESKVSNPDAHRRVLGFIQELNDSLEGILNREAPKLGEKFRAANANWRTYKTQREALEKLIGGKGDEHIVKSIMNTTAKIEPLKEIIGEDKVKEIGKSYVSDILWKLNKSGIARADTAKEAIRNSKAQIVATMGEGDYHRLMDNLTYLNSTGRPLTISRESLYNLLDNRGAGFKGYLLQLAGAANTVAESKGTNLTKAVKDSVVETTLGGAKKASNAVDKVSGGNKLSGLANIMGDNFQRSSAYLPAPSQKLTAQEEEALRRKRAISGGKGMK